MLRDEALDLDAVGHRRAHGLLAEHVELLARQRLPEEVDVLVVGRADDQRVRAAPEERVPVVVDRRLTKPAAVQSLPRLLHAPGVAVGDGDDRAAAVLQKADIPDVLQTHGARPGDAKLERRRGRILESGHRDYGGEATWVAVQPVFRDRKPRARGRRPKDLEVS